MLLSQVADFKTCMKLLSVLAGLILPHVSIVHTPELEAKEQYNILHYLGGSGPYFQYPGHGISPNLPPDCELEQVYLIGRHGERFPTSSAGVRFEGTLKKLKLRKLQGSLEFFNTYDYFVTDKTLYDQEVTTSNSDSIFNGEDSALRNGQSFREKYDELYSNQEELVVFTSNSRRCHDTSVNFMKGLMGKEYDPDKIKYNIIDEDAKMGANSLTPRTGCKKFMESNVSLDLYNITSHLEDLKIRLTKENPGLDLNNQDLDNLFEMCAYEVNVKGYSPICGIFRNDELIMNEYKQDLRLYHQIGYGNEMSKSLGSVFSRALIKLFKEGSGSSNKIWLNFTHDYDIINFYAGLSLFKEELGKQIKFDREFKKSFIIPQSTRLIIEQFKYRSESYIRLIINDAVVPLSCKFGPGYSCKMKEFVEILTKNSQINYNQECGNSDGPNEITFYWDYLTRDYSAPLFP